MAASRQSRAKAAKARDRARSRRRDPMEAGSTYAIAVQGNEITITGPMNPDAAVADARQAAQTLSDAALTLSGTGKLPATILVAIGPRNRDSTPMKDNAEFLARYRPIWIQKVEADGRIVDAYIADVGKG